MATPYIELGCVQRDHILLPAGGRSNGTWFPTRSGERVSLGDDGVSADLSQMSLHLLVFNGARFSYRIHSHNPKAPMANPSRKANHITP